MKSNLQAIKDSILAIANDPKWARKAGDNYDEEHVVNDNCAEYVRQQLITSGESAEWEVFIPTSTMLAIDYDNGFPRERFDRAMDLLIRYLNHDSAAGPRMNYWEYESRSGNKHVVIEMGKSMPPLERVAWQAIFGSDPVREALHIQSFKDGRQDPIILVMRKDRDERHKQQQL